MRRVVFFLLTALTATASASGPLSWQVHAPVPHGDGQASVTVAVTLHNASGEPIQVRAITTTCGCTVPRTRPLPWTLAPGRTEAVDVTIDLRGKSGAVRKSLGLVTSAGPFTVPLDVDLRADPAVRRRLDNQLIALADARAIFTGDCARCHVEPARGQQGRALFMAACAICHEAQHRAESVPLLPAGGEQPDRAYWERWIRNGAPGSLMPGFGRPAGGFLEEEQIRTLVDFLLRRARGEATAAGDQGL